MTRIATSLAPDVSYCDLEFLGQPNAIATGILTARAGVALVDPGPSTSLGTLERALQAEGITWQDVRTILLTHIHLDHAGATGTILARHPHIEVVVHERGAAHLTDPSKLVNSATRYFGQANMERFWGQIAPVPPDRLRLVSGGERVAAGGRTFEVVYTPGHAYHHVAYFDPTSGIAFVGDTAAMRVKGGAVVPPTTPPDFDMKLWLDSIERVAALGPQTAFLTHFGPVENVEAHLQAAAESLRWMTNVVQESLGMDATDAERSEAFGARVRQQLLAATDPQLITAYEPTSPLEALWFGIARYLRRQ